MLVPFVTHDKSLQKIVWTTFSEIFSSEIIFLFPKIFLGTMDESLLICLTVSKRFLSCTGNARTNLP